MTENAAPFTQNWSAEVLKKLPLIAPVHRYTYPMQVPGEEQALARGAFRLLVHPSAGGMFLATCALGFTDPAMPTGLFACPNPDEMCAVAGGYAYIANVTHPKDCTHISLKPVVEVRVLLPQRLLLFIGFHSLVAWGVDGLAWESAAAQLGRPAHHVNRRRHAARLRLEPDDRQRGGVLARSAYRAASGRGL